MAKRIKIPKRIAGMKIPKAIRKGPIGDFLRSSGGQMIVAEALLALGAVYAARRSDPSSPTGDLLRHPVEHLRARLGDGGLISARDRLEHACRAAMHAFREALNDSEPDGETAAERLDIDTAGEAIEPEKDDARPKKASRSRGEASGANPH